MEKVEIEVLTQHNYPVIRMPGRRFPGVVIQGDSLSNLVIQVQELRDALGSATGAEDL